MKVTLDTNVLLRLVIEDDPAQTRAAQAALALATVVAIPLATFCEFVWMMRRGYRLKRNDVADIVVRFADAEEVVCDRAAVDAGIAMLRAGGDFADGVIAFDGARSGGETFLSFDRRALTLVRGSGGAAASP